MNKKLLWISLAFFVVLGGIVFWASKDGGISQNSLSDKESIFFYGATCPHCKNVDKFLEENKGVEERFKFEKLEISNKDNAKRLMEKAEKCGLPTDNIGVPLFWDGEKCIVGDVDIISFLKSKID